MRTRLLARSATAALSALTLAACATNDGREMMAPESTTTSPLQATTTAAKAVDGSVVDDGWFGGVGPTSPTVQVPGATTLQLVAPWANGAPIDASFTCDGVGAAPRFSWSPVPGATELAVSIVDDTNIVNLAITGIAPDAVAVDPAALTGGAALRVNSFGMMAYAPLCPDPGVDRVYTVTLYALARRIEVDPAWSVVELFADIQAATLTSVSVTGTYARASS